MDSRELGLVNSAFNSLLGTMSAQSTQQVASANTFNKIFDNKLQYADKQIATAHKTSDYEKVNREKASVTNSEQEKDRDAYVKSDMQKPKKPIAKATKEKVETISVESKSVDKPAEKPTKETQAIESDEVTDGVNDTQKIDDNEVLKEIMILLGNDQLTDQQKIEEINLLLSELTSEDLSGLQNSLGDLKNMLMSLNGSLKDFEEVLSKLSVEGSTFSNVLEAMESTTPEPIILNNLEEKTMTPLETHENPEKITERSTSEKAEMVQEVATKETATETVVPLKEVVETPKETKGEQLKAAAEAETLAKAQTTTEVNTDSSSNRQSSQQQSTSDSNQSFAESLKFHSATVKTAAMKSTMASNPFEEKIMQQIIKGTQISMNVGKDVSEMMIKLNPKDLGNVSLKISLKNEQLVAEFSVENKTVKEVLESRLDDLKTALSDKGFTIQGLDVSVDQDQNEQFRSYEEFIKQQKGKKKFAKEDGVEGLGGIEESNQLSRQTQTLETTSSEINTLA